MVDELGEKLVAAFNGLFGVHAGVRAAHAKGTCCTGTFVATEDAAKLTRAPHMQGDPVPVTVRFSNGSGKPDALDSGRDPRGMAVKFHLPDGKETDIVSISQPGFIVRTVDDFLEVMRLRVPDPATGQPDLQKLIEFVTAHPESQRSAQNLLTAPPLASFLRWEYFGVHAFRWIAPDGTESGVRYYWEPSLGTESLTPEEAAQRTPDYLREDLLARLEKEPASFTLQVQIANEGDDLNDPTTEWPEDRRRVVAGRLEVTGPVPDQAACEEMMFDPTRLVNGIRASKDPILAARGRAYAVSLERRLATR